MSATLSEHLDYLSDAVRLQRFRQAIAQAVRPGDVVVDLGCGFGVLGLMCLEAGAARVYGIERGAAIEVARETVARAGYADRYHCIRENSLRVDLPERADVVICDHVGCFGFDYGIIEILADARRRFLKPGGTIIPGRIDLRIAGITSQAGRDVAFAWDKPQIPAQFHWLVRHSINAKHTLVYQAGDVVTDEVTLGSLDLLHDIPDSFRFTAELTAQSDGMLDGLGGWFDCEVVPGLRMTNSPLSPDCINRRQVFLAFERAMPVTAEDRVRVTIAVRHDAFVIAWSAENLRTGEKRKHSTWQGQILGQPAAIAG